uniref:Uncharacterized protein n=1 Tax=Tanacetum cinerariifolium TaxID=118510 RepID=A0A6L2JJ62_TANCI|nr:hypothetical protein [Tanacetum cinerariifolium]
MLDKEREESGERERYVVEGNSYENENKKRICDGVAINPDAVALRIFSRFLYDGYSPDAVKNSLTRLLDNPDGVVTNIKEAKDFRELPLDELIGNLNVYEMVNDSDTQEESEFNDEYNFLVRNFKRFMKTDTGFGRKGNGIIRGNRFGVRVRGDINKRNNKVLPYGVLLTRLSRHIKLTKPDVLGDSYLGYNLVMGTIGVQKGKGKRPHTPSASSSTPTPPLWMMTKCEGSSQLQQQMELSHMSYVKSLPELTNFTNEGPRYVKE